MDVEPRRRQLGGIIFVLLSMEETVGFQYFPGS